MATSNWQGLALHPAAIALAVLACFAASKLVAHGNNRADYSFIPGGMIPGVVINEYAADAASLFILAANAAETLTRSTP